MDRTELDNLFRAYLNREPDKDDVQRHIHKDFYVFEKEIANCAERKKLLGIGDLILNSKKERVRIAVLVTGHVRNLNIKNSLNNIYSKCDVDVFVFTWDNVGLKGKETDLEDKSDSENIKNIVGQLSNVKKLKVENNKQFIESNNSSDTVYFNYSSPEIFIKSQLYSILKCYELMEEHIKETGVYYDLVIRCRMDCEFLSFNLDDKTIDDVNENDIIFVPNSDNKHEHPDNSTSCWACDTMYYRYGLKEVHIFEHTNIVCDLFAYGSVKSMKDYCSLFLHYDKLNESFLQDNLKAIKKYKNLNYVKDGNVYRFLDMNKVQNSMAQRAIHDRNKKNHIDSVYYLYCSYPERLLQKHLREYMLIKSTTITMRFYR